jgi:CBS domain-containing protein
MNATLMQNRTLLTLKVHTAEELMTSNPVSISDQATVGEALALLTDKGFSAAPVIDQAGRPVGVLSRTDLLIHQREATPRLRVSADEAVVPEGFHVEEVDATPVHEVMTPVVFSVAPDTPSTEVVQQLLGLNVHRLFVIDDTGVLVGVISTSDVLRHLES